MPDVAARQARPAGHVLAARMLGERSDLHDGEDAR